VRAWLAAVSALGLYAAPAVAQEARAILMAAPDGTYPVPAGWQPCGSEGQGGWPFSAGAFHPVNPGSAPVTILFREKEGDACHPIAFRLSRRMVTPLLLQAQGRARWRPDLALRMEVALPLQAGWAPDEVPAKLKIPGLGLTRPLACSAVGCVATFPFATREEARRILGEPLQKVELAEVAGMEAAAGWSIYEPAEGGGAVKVARQDAADLQLVLPDHLTALEFSNPAQEIRLTSIESAFLSPTEPVRCSAGGQALDCGLTGQGASRALALKVQPAAGTILIAAGKGRGADIQVQVAISTSAAERFTVVAPRGDANITLPEGRVVCESGLDLRKAGAGAVTMTGRPAGWFGVMAAPKGGDCKAPEARRAVVLEVVPPALKKEDVDRVLLDRDPGAPTHLRAVLHSATLAADDRIRATTVLVAPPGGTPARAPAACGGADGRWCAFDLERPGGWGDSPTVALSVATEAAALRPSQPLYQADGKELSPRAQPLEGVATAWRVPPGAGRPTAALHEPPKDKAQVEVKTPLAWLFAVGKDFTTRCTGNDGRPVERCARVASVGTDALTLEINGAEVQKVSRGFAWLDVPLRPNGVKVATGDATPAFDEALVFRIVLSGDACTYALTQLTAVYADPGPGLVFFKVSGGNAMSLECPGPRSWTGYRATVPLKAGAAEGAADAVMDVLWFPGLPGDVFALQLPAGLQAPGAPLTLMDGPRKVALAPGSGLLVTPGGPLLRDGPQVSTVLPGGPQDITEFGLAEDKEDKLRFAAPAADLQRWRLRLEGSPVDDCAGGEAVGPDFCVKPLPGTSGEAKVTVTAEYLDAVPLEPEAGPLRPPLALRPLFTRKLDRFVAGTRAVVLGSIHPWKKALDLDQHAWMECGRPSSPANWSPFRGRPVQAWATIGPRAASVEELRRCKLAVDLSSNGKENPSLSQEAARSAANARASALLKEFGPQDLDVDVEVFAPDAAEDAKPASKQTLRLAVGYDALQDALVDARRRDDNDADVVYLDLEIDPNGANPVEDYGIVRVTARHHAPAEYRTFKDSAPSAVMQAQLRRMPNLLAGRFPGFLQGALHLDGGSGLRAYVTFSLPTAMLRAPNLNRAVTSSTKYDSIETVALGVGGAAILEPWDFDRNIALLPLNPQVHAGFFLSELPRGNDPLPRVSLVFGFGVRLPFGLSEESRKTNLRTVLWYELSRRARSTWEASVLAGFAVNFGNFPN